MYRTSVELFYIGGYGLFKSHGLIIRYPREIGIRGYGGLLRILLRSSMVSLIFSAELFARTLIFNKFMIDLKSSVKIKQLKG